MVFRLGQAAVSQVGEVNGICIQTCRGSNWGRNLIMGQLREGSRAPSTKACSLVVPQPATGTLIPP